MSLGPSVGARLQQRLSGLPIVRNDRAFLDAIEESNCMPIPNALALSLHIPSEEKTGLSYQKWASPMIEHIKCLAQHLDADRQVRLLNIYIEDPQPMTLMIGHLVHRVEAHFPIAEDALLNIVAPARLAYNDLFLESTHFKHIHVDYRFDDTQLRPPVTTESIRDFNLTTGITLTPELCAKLDSSSLQAWLSDWCDRKPTRISLEALMDCPQHANHSLFQSGHDALWMKLHEHGYHLIGTATFALADCPLAQAFIQDELGIGVEGYDPAASLDHFGIGLGAISQTAQYLAVNHHQPHRYLQTLRNQHLPVMTGGYLSQDTLIREAIMTELTCHFRLPIDALQRRFFFCFKHEFGQEYAAILQWVKAGLMRWHGKELWITDQGLAHLPALVSTFIQPLLSQPLAPDPIGTIA